MKLRVRPSRVIGDEANPYMLRWHIFRIGNLPRVFVHKFLRSDYDRALHNHPWWFISIIIKGQYLEHMPNGDTVLRKAGSVVRRGLEHSHRIELIKDCCNVPGALVPMLFPIREQPCWTLFITGPDVRRWGFFCPKGFVDSADFTGCEE